MASMVFFQEAGAASQTLRFEGTRLVVTESDAKAARELNLSYLDVDVDGPSPPEPSPRGLKRALAALPGAGPRIYARYALFAPRRGALAIWRDAQAEAIVAELKTRWREARRRAVSVDFGAEPRREIARFELLLNREIVSAEECAVALARIAAKATGMRAQ